MRKYVGRDPFIVLNNFSLGEADPRIHDLVKIGEDELFTVDLCRVRRHASFLQFRRFSRQPTAGVSGSDSLIDVSSASLADAFTVSRALIRIPICNLVQISWCLELINYRAVDRPDSEQRGNGIWIASLSSQ